MRACEEIWARWVEADRLDDTLRLRKRPIRARTPQTMNHNLTCGLNIVRHGRKIVALCMPD